jgi:hypothetical protein
MTPEEATDTIRAELRPVFEADVALSMLYAAAISVDVERLARALQHSNHGTRYRDKFGAAYTFDELSDEQRRQMRDDADNIAAAYEAIPTCGVCSDLSQPHAECSEHGA